MNEMFFPIVVAISAIYFILMAVMVQTGTFLYSLFFKFVPVVLGILLGFYALNLFGIFVIVAK